MSAYRTASRIREGWQVKIIATEDSDGQWLTVTRVLRVYSPLSFVRLELEDGFAAAFAPGDEVRCRTLTEIKREAAKS